MCPKGVEIGMLTLDKVFNAQTVLKGVIRETPITRAYGIAPECELFLKPENLQITGSFKVRGAGYKRKVYMGRLRVLPVSEIGHRTDGILCRPELP